MHTHGHLLQILLFSILPLLLLSCGSDRVNIEFKTSPKFYIDDSKTDTDNLNKELEHDIREAEKKRRQKKREAETVVKERAEAERKAKEGQNVHEQSAVEETTHPEEAEQSTSQQ